MLVPMKYKSFIWPQNPRVFEMEYQRTLRHCKVPLTELWTVQDLGRRARIIRGEGEFVGDSAYDSFKQLTELFNAGGKGVLYHPVWGSITAYLSKLSLREEPGEDYLAYRFEFMEALYDSTVEDDSGYYAYAQASTGKIRYVEAEEDDTVYTVAAMNDLTVAELMSLNPWIEDADMTLRTGQLIKV